MAMQKPDDPITFDQVFMLVDKFTPVQQKKLQEKLTAKVWGTEWDQLVADVAEDNKNLPPLSEQEIYAEFTKHRSEQRMKRAQGNR